eukprot:331906-Chlamydomonas_euryale.AAC.1
MPLSIRMANSGVEVGMRGKGEVPERGMVRGGGLGVGGHVEASAHAWCGGNRNRRIGSGGIGRGLSGSIGYAEKCRRTDA